MKDNDFFHLMDINDEERLRNSIWVHPQGKAAYQEFHDVVCINTTYLVNRYDMPFCSFVGVNHHCQSILLGCALASKEDIPTYRWLFSTWVNAMGANEPLCLLTYQDESIRVLVRELWPNTIHRFCIWHIFVKLPIKFKRHRSYFDIKTEFTAIVCESVSIAEFEMRWQEFRARYGLERNQWLDKLYGENENWVSVYLQHFFWAGMKSIQRSESMHAFFDGYTNSQSTLKSYVEQYEVALREKHEKELKKELAAMTKIIKCYSEFLWDKQLERAYTPTIFAMVKQEITRMAHCDLSILNHVGEVEAYQIRDGSLRLDAFGNWFIFTVHHSTRGEYYACNCKMFESRGIICCHIMKVLSHKGIPQINDRYILRRWRRDMPHPHLNKFFHGGYPQMTEEYKSYRELLVKFERLADIGLDDSLNRQYKNTMLDAAANALLDWNDRTAETVRRASARASAGANNPLQNPQLRQKREAKTATS